MIGPILLAISWLLLRLEGKGLGVLGLMCALAFAKTQSIALPIGLHLGWNLVSYLGFSTGPLGPGLFVPGNGAARIDVTGLPNLLLDMLLPLLLVAGVCGVLVRAHNIDARPIGETRTAE